MPAGCQGAAQGGGFDAVCAAGDDDPFALGQPLGQVGGYVCAVGAGGPGPGQRHSVGQRCGQECLGALSPQRIRRPLAEVGQASRPVRIVRDENRVATILTGTQPLG